MGALTPSRRQRSIAGRKAKEDGAMSDFDVALRGFAALDGEALSRPWLWRDKAMDVRFALYRTLEDEQEVHVRLSAAHIAESRTILAIDETTFAEHPEQTAG